MMNHRALECYKTLDVWMQVEYNLDFETNVNIREVVWFGNIRLILFNGKSQAWVLVVSNQRRGGGKEKCSDRDGGHAKSIRTDFCASRREHLYYCRSFFWYGRTETRAYIELGVVQNRKIQRKKADRTVPICWRTITKIDLIIAPIDRYNAICIKPQSGYHLTRNKKSQR